MKKTFSEYLKDHGVKLDTFKKDATRSDKIILVKNLPSGALPTELRFKFEKFGGLGRIIMPPSGLAALVEFDGSINAKRAFKAVAYSRFGDRPLYLEWAPSGRDLNNYSKIKQLIILSLLYQIFLISILSPFLIVWKTRKL